MKCPEAQRYFDEMYREGEAFGRSEAAEHVKQCARCGDLYAKWRGIAQELSSPSPAPSPSEGFRQRIMASIEERRPHAVLFPFPQRLAWAALLLITLGGFWGVQFYRAKSVLPAPQKTAAAQTVHFEFASGAAASVAIVGDFNGWDTRKHLMAKKDGRTWSIDLPIHRGSYLYLFLIDGKEWRTDPLRGTPVPDGFGGYNSEISL